MIFMLGDLSSAESLKLICDVSDAIKRELNILIVVSLEAVEEVAESTDPLISLSGDAFIDLGEPVPDQLRCFQSTHTAILSFGQMTTDDILGSRVQLNEFLDISSSDTFSSLGNAVLDDIP